MRNNYYGRTPPARNYPSYPKEDVSFSDDSKLNKYFKILLIISSIAGILSGIAIMLLAFGIKLPLNVSLEILATIAAISAIICGLYTLIGLIKKRREF